MGLSLEEFIETSKARTDRILDSLDSPTTLLEALIFCSVHYFADYFQHNEEPFDIHSCVRVFCDYGADGIWPCDDEDYSRTGEYLLSLELSNVLTAWNVWHTFFDDHFSWPNNSAKGLQKEAIAFDCVGLQVAKWVKIEVPQVEVRYLHAFMKDARGQGLGWKTIE